MSSDGFRMSAVLKGLGNAVMAMIAFTILVGGLYTFAPLSSKSISILVIISYLVSTAIGSIAAAKTSKSNGWLHGGSTGLVYTLVLWALLVSGFVPATSATALDSLIGLIVGFVVGSIGGMIGVTLS